MLVDSLLALDLDQINSKHTALLIRLLTPQRLVIRAPGSKSLEPHCLLDYRKHVLLHCKVGHKTQHTNSKLCCIYLNVSDSGTNHLQPTLPICPGFVPGLPHCGLKSLKLLVRLIRLLSLLNLSWLC